MIGYSSIIVYRWNILPDNNIDVVYLVFVQRTSICSTLITCTTKPENIVHSLFFLKVENIVNFVNAYQNKMHVV